VGCGIKAQAIVDVVTDVSRKHCEVSDMVARVAGGCYETSSSGSAVLLN